jgi:hypothetical protein
MSPTDKNDEKPSLDEWLDAAFADSESRFKSDHFGDIADTGYNGKAGIDLLRFSSLVLLKAAAHLSDSGAESLGWRSFVRLPLGYAVSIPDWQSSTIETIGADPEPPSLYVAKINCVCSMEAEEYHRPVSLPGISDAVAIFRAFRDERKMRLSHEFTCALFLYPSNVGRLTIT